MRKGWLTATLLGGTATVAQGADVRIFGLHTPSTGQWSVYAQVTNTGSTVAGNVSGISSIGVNVLDNNGNVVRTATNMLPSGSTPYTNPDNGLPVRYGFSYTDNGTLKVEGSKSGIFGIDGVQASFQTPSETPPSTVPYRKLVLPGIGVSAGTQGIDADHTSATNWSYPVLIGKGTYTQASPNTADGLKLEYSTQIVNLARKYTSGGLDYWDRENAVGKVVADAKSFTTGSFVFGSTTTKAGLGDINLDGQVGFSDLVVLAQNYNATTGKTWFQGDLNTDGAVNFGDLVLLAQNYNKAVPADAIPAGFAAEWSAAVAAVPEPGGVGLLGAAVVAWLGSKRKRKMLVSRGRL